MKHKRKAPTGKGSGAILSNNKYWKYNTYFPISLPTTALCPSLRRYRDDLQRLPADKHILQLINCCEYLLAEIDGGSHVEN